jgi:T-complex protein 1 subunit theta
MEQYALKKYAEAFEVFARTLAENTGLDATKAISDLIAAHSTNPNFGVVAEEMALGDAKEASIFDVFAGKTSAVKLASDAVVTILSIDQIVMAKPAGGPRLPGQRQGGGMDQEADFGY